MTRFLKEGLFGTFSSFLSCFTYPQKILLEIPEGFFVDISECFF
tara:strand:+ start:10985 stop:11116 length:132 start_codon:yes stop_codon:yes gene_type:complete